MKNKHLFEARKLLGLPTALISKCIGISRSTYYGIENNKHNPGIELAIKICSFFDINMEETFDYKKIKQHLRSRGRPCLIRRICLIGNNYNYHNLDLDFTRELIDKGISSLNERDQDIINSYYFKDHSLSKISKKHMISIGRVSQIRNRSTRKLKIYFTKNLKLEEFKL